MPIIDKKQFNVVDRFIYNSFLKIRNVFVKEKELSDVMTEKERARYWINKFKKEEVLYNAQDSSVRDVRNFIFPRSYVFNYIIKKYKLKGKTHDKTVLNCCLFVQKNITYVGDDKSRGQMEFWQYPEDTLTRGTGDCEDGAILMKSLILACGVPDWKVKVVCGNVKGGGHAYCTYIRSDNEQVILDWCYWANSLPVNDRLPMEQERNYYEIWFSFNRRYSYAEVKTVYSGGKIKQALDK